MDLASALGNRGGTRLPWFTARLWAIDTATNRAKISAYDSEPVWLPFMPGVYEGITTVYVLNDPSGTGSGQLVLGPCYAEDPATVPAPPPEPPPPAAEQNAAAATTVLDEATIRPVWSGTYRSIRGTWDRWNTGRYGGRSTLYQGNAYGSGPLTGLAVYGTQVKALGALEIVAMRVTTPEATGSGTVTLQGSPHGSKPSGAPTTTGATATGTASVNLPATVREAFRTGDVRGLATVGASYRATYGSGRAGGMTLAIQYRRPA